MTASPTWPDHLLGLEEWAALPEDSDRRIELAEGVLVVSPRPLSRHQELIMRLGHQVHAGAAGRWRARPEFEVVVDEGPPATVRVPDVVVASAGLPGHAPRIDAADALALVEILSPGTRRRDRVTKLDEYAEAGVRWYLIVEPGPPAELTELELVDGAYVEVARHRTTAALRLGVTLDLDL